jgi:hypothetical protein
MTPKPTPGFFESIAKKIEASNVERYCQASVRINENLLAESQSEANLIRHQLACREEFQHAQSRIAALSLKAQYTELFARCTPPQLEQLLRELSPEVLALVGVSRPQLPSSAQTLALPAPATQQLSDRLAAKQVEHIVQWCEDNQIYDTPEIERRWRPALVERYGQSGMNKILALVDEELENLY